MNKEPLVLFDGICHLCNGAVRFLVRHDRNKRLWFAPIQSAPGRERLRQFALPAEGLDTMVLVYADRYYTRSTAVLHMARELGGVWKALYVFVLIPRPLRDALYNLVARNRYRWFGKRETCMVPVKEVKDRFLV